MDMGYLTYTQIWVRAKGGQAQTSLSAQELTRKGQKKTPISHPAPPGDRTQGLRVRIPML